MFVGHYAAALAAKAAEPRAPLWTYVGAAQLIDIAWAGFVMGGIERMRIDETLPGSPLVLEHMPWTHSLPAAVLWSLAAAVAVGVLLKLPRAAAIMVGLVVFSHWLGDLLVHRPDLELWFGGDKVGLALWNYPVPEEALEMGLLGLCAAAWGWRRGRQGQSLTPVLWFAGFLVTLQIVALVLPGSGDAAGFGRTALIAYLVTTGLAWLADRGSPTATS